MPKNNSDDRPIQHTPKHLQDDAELFDSRHPAASAFAVAQPAAGVVANDVEERGQNLAGGTKADDAEKEYVDQQDVLAKQHQDSLKAAHPQSQNVKIEGDTAKADKDANKAESKSTK